MWNLRGKKEPILAREFSAGLEVVGHVESTTRSLPLRRADSVIPDRVENVLARLTVFLEMNRRGRPVEKLRHSLGVTGDLAKLFLGSIPKSVMPRARIDPRVCLVAIEAHRG